MKNHLSCLDVLKKLFGEKKPMSDCLAHDTRVSCPMNSSYNSKHFESLAGARAEKIFAPPWPFATMSCSSDSMVRYFF